MSGSFGQTPVGLALAAGFGAEDPGETSPHPASARQATDGNTRTADQRRITPPCPRNDRTPTRGIVASGKAGLALRADIDRRWRRTLGQELAEQPPQAARREQLGRGGDLVGSPPPVLLMHLDLVRGEVVAMRLEGADSREEEPLPLAVAPALPRKDVLAYPDAGTEAEVPEPGLLEDLPPSRLHMALTVQQAATRRAPPGKAGIAIEKAQEQDPAGRVQEEDSGRRPRSRGLRPQRHRRFEVCRAGTSTRFSYCVPPRVKAPVKRIAGSKYP